MSDLSNLILQVTFNNWNTYSYSPRVNTILSFSADVGAGVEPLSYISPFPKYFYDAKGNAIDLVEQCKEIDGSSNLEAELIKMLEDVKDLEGQPILNSDYKFTLPHSFQYGQAKDIKVTKIHTHYADSLWIGLLEHKARRYVWDPDIVNFTYKTNLSNIDLMLNAYIDNHIDLTNSDNYLKTILVEIANRHGESLRIEDACDYFLDKPIRMLILAEQKGIAYIIENGYEEYKEHLQSGYVITRPTRQEVPSVYSTRLFDNRYIDKASVSYEMMCDRAGIRPNFTLFERWHEYNFKDCRTHEDNLVNTIVRLSTGYDFTLANWNYFQQAVFDLGCKQHTDETSSSIFKKWIDSRR